MKNKKFAKILATIMIVAVAVMGFAGCSANKDNEKYMKDETEVSETMEVKLTDYVVGLHDWTVEINSENVDFMKDVKFNEEVVKEVKVDDSKVDLTKEGRYDLTYTIVPCDDSIVNVDVTKKVTVKVVSVEEAQKEADAGKQVAVSGNEVKKNSEGKTPVAPKQEEPRKDVPKKDNSSSNSGNTGNKNPGKDNGSNTGNSGDKNNGSSKPSQPTNPPKQDNNSQGGNNNQGNNNSGNKEPEKPAEHKCNFNIHVAEKSHMAEREVSYTVDVPVYTTIGWYECKVCHAQFDNTTDCAYHCLMECDSTYTYKTKQEQTGTKQETRYKTEQYKVIDDPEHYECSCGKRK